MTKKTKIFLYILSACSFITSFILLLIRFNSKITQSLMIFIQKFRPDIGMEKIVKLYSFIDCNILFFFLFGISFILLVFLRFNNEDEYSFKFFYPIKAFNKEKYNWILAFIFIFITIIRFYWITQKITFHMDELYGISILHYNEYGLWSGKDFDKLIPYTGKQIKDLIFFDNGSIKDTFKDLIHLWIYNRDPAYNNLFFIISRIWYTGLETSDFTTIIWRESLLNYIFFCFSFYFFILLLNKITDNKITKAICIILAFLNPATIGISVFLRSYALQETLLILFTYLFVLYIKNINEKHNINNKRNFIATTLILFLVMNCDYFSFLYIGILGLILIIYLVYKKEFSTLYSLICSLFLALIISKICYLNFGVGFFTDRGTEAFNVFNSSENRFLKALTSVYNLISFNICNLIVLFIILVIGIILHKKDLNFHILIFNAAFLWCFTVMLFAPYNTLRYIAPIFPLFTIALAYKKQSNTLLNYILSSLLIIPVILSFINVMPLKTNNSKIEHLNEADPKVLNAEYLNDVNTKVYIDRSSLYAQLLPYLNDQQIYYFVDSLEEIKSYNLTDKKFYYIKYNDDSTHEFTVLKINN